MKAIVLAGGYATRLMPLTTHIPKALLPVDGKPIIDFLIEKMEAVDEIDEIVISTNERFKNHFFYWEKGLTDRLSKPLKIIIEPTMKEEEKLGAIGALDFVIQKAGLQKNDLMILAGDNLFEFELTDFIDFWKQHKQKPVAAFCDLGDLDEVREKYGVGILNESSLVTAFQEKSSQPGSTLASTGCYIYPSEVTSFLRTYLDDPETNKDAPGYFVEWLRSQTEMYGFVFDDAWYDIGSFSSYDQVNEDYAGKVTIKEDEHE